MGDHFNTWFITNATEMAYNYNSRIKKLEDDLELLKRVIKSLYVDGDIDIDTHAGSADMNVNILVSTNSHQDVYVEDYEELCNIQHCDNCNTTWIVQRNDIYTCPCKQK